MSQTIPTDTETPPDATLEETIREHAAILDQIIAELQEIREMLREIANAPNSGDDPEQSTTYTD